MFVPRQCAWLQFKRPVDRRHRVGVATKHQVRIAQVAPGLAIQRILASQLLEDRASLRRSSSSTYREVSGSAQCKLVVGLEQQGLLQASRSLGQIDVVVLRE